MDGILYTNKTNALRDRRGKRESVQLCDNNGAQISTQKLSITCQYPPLISLFGVLLSKLSMLDHLHGYFAFF